MKMIYNILNINYYEIINNINKVICKIYYILMIYIYIIKIEIRIKIIDMGKSSTKYHIGAVLFNVQNVQGALNAPKRFN